MQPQSTAQNSLCWRIWHGVNYQNGGICFIIGSALLFPFFATLLDSATVSAWFYTVGSITFLLADITEWLHYTRQDCPFFQLSLNFMVSVLGSTFYLIGSAELLPFINKTDQAYLCFIIGSSLIFLSQAWKEWRTLTQPGKSASQGYEEDVSGFYVDLFAGLGGLMYLIGSFPLSQSAQKPEYVVPGVIIYCFGGVFFTLSGVFMQKRYFC
jgi:hypothetical protein